MKKLLLAIFALCLFAQHQTAFADTWTVGQQPLSYSPSGTNVIGDGTTAQGGIPPAYENGTAPVEEADIADNFTTSLYLATTVDRKTVATGGSEAKFRLSECNFGFIGHFDPIVFPGVANAGHLHMIWGNLALTKDSTYSQLRQNGESTCPGNKINRTAYWAPAFMEDINGISAVRAFDTVVGYYQTGNLTTDPPADSRIPKGFTYIGGYDPGDPNNTKQTGPIGIANALAGGARYTTNIATYGLGTSSGTGFSGWGCLDTTGNAVVNGSNANSPVPGSSFQPYLQNPDGTATLTCPAGGGLIAQIFAPSCWDGHNLHSGGSVALPGSSGRLHVAYPVHDNNTGGNVCPTGWWKIPEFEGKFLWSLKGVEDVGKFYLSSDVMNYGAADPTSRSPCRQVSSHYCHGETMHFDWWGAWSYGTAASPGVMLKWMNHCTGVKIIDSTGTMNGDPGECNSGTIDTVNNLIIGTTSGGLPFGDPTVKLRNAAGTSKYRLELDTNLHNMGPIAHPHGAMNDNMPMPANDNPVMLAGVAPISFDLRSKGR
jgi:hypothetical protein